MQPSSSKSIIIIGAGVAGLAAGCYAQMYGYHSQIFEMHTLPGGVCTSWKRKGYTFDGAIHWLTGTQPGSSINQVLQEVGALDNKQLISHEIFRQIVIDNEHLNVYTNVARLEQEMLRVAPEDKKLISSLIGEIRRFSKFELPLDRNQPTISEFTRMLPFLPAVMKYQRTSIEEYGNRFTNPFLRQAFMNIFPMPDASMLVAILTLALFNRGDNGYPEGGSLKLSTDIEQRYIALGGKIKYHSKVAKILIEDKRAVGIKLSDNSEYRADYVISAADGYSTLFKMIGEAYLDEVTIQNYRDLPLFKPLIYVCLGIDYDLSKEPHIVTNVLEPPMFFADENHERIGWFHYCYDRSSAPKGNSCVVSMIETNFEFWSKAHQNQKEYETEKNKVASLVIDKMEERYPGIRRCIEVIDVATPLTWVRYTGNWKGAYEGWRPTRKALSAKIRKSLPGLDGLYMCGQWVEPGGGVPVSIISGRNVIKMICKQDKKHFHSIY